MSGDHPVLGVPYSYESISPFQSYSLCAVFEFCMGPEGLVPGPWCVCQYVVRSRVRVCPLDYAPNIQVLTLCVSVNVPFVVRQ